MTYGKAVLLSLACWIVFLAASAQAGSDAEAALTFSVVGFVCLAIAHGITQLATSPAQSSVVPYQAAAAEPAPFKLSDSLLVDEQLRAIGIGDVKPEEPVEVAESAREVQRLYAALDD
jgi:hypothetical protein